MPRFDGARERVALSIFDTISSEGTAKGRLFTTPKPDTKGYAALGGTAMLPSDSTMIIARVVLEARAARRDDLGVLRTDLRLELVVGEKAQPLLPPLLDKIADDGTARYDYYTDPFFEDEDSKVWRAELQKKAAAGDEPAKRYLGQWKERQPHHVQVPARQGFHVNYEATEKAQQILRHPETLARVWLIGTLTRDIQ